MTKRPALVELVIGRMREFRREPSAFFFVLLMPLIWMVVLGFGLSGDRMEKVRIGWENTSPSSSPVPALLEELKAASKLNVTEGDADQLATLLKRGDVLVVLRPSPNGVTYVYDPANRESRRARDLANDAVQAAGGRRDPVGATDERATIAGTRYVDFLVPGLISLTVLSTSLFGVGMTLVANRRENLLKRLLATPMHPYQYILSHIIGRVLVLLLEVGTILVAAWAIFHFRVEGRFVDFLAFAMLGAAALTAMGIFLGSRLTNAGAMNGICNLVMLPMMMISGVWFSRANFPDWLQHCAQWLPLTPYVDGLRRIALEGVPLTALTFEVGILAVYFVVCSVLAKALFKWH